MESANCPSRTRQPGSLLLCLLAGFGLFSAKNAFATEYYVATTGSDSNPGTQTSPFATLTKGASAAGPGDTVYIRGGTYNPSDGFTFSKSGTSDTNRIKYWAYPGEVPVFDFSKASGHPDGFTVTGSWLHFKGIEICNLTEDTSAINAIVISKASNDIMELMNTHHNQGSGIFISHGSGGHLFLNCDSHDNYDPTSAQGDGQNSDGFGVHYQAAGDGTSTTIRGCRAWWNSDDGYDFINQEFPVTIENSWAFGSGFSNYGAGRPADGNGNGFKIGSSKTGIRHLVQNNVAWGCKASGFYANHSSGGNTWYNNTSFQNGTQFNMLASTWSAPNGGGTRTDGVKLTGDKAHILRNNIGFPNKNEYMDAATYGVDTQFNTWDLNITPAAKDFLSITDATVGGTGQAIETTSLALGPRQADGSLPNVDFMKLAAGSAMIDKGTDVKLPFVGAAPDLGAYEYGASGAGGGGGTVAVPGGGGTTGAGGKTGSGGSTSTAGNGGTPGTGGRPTVGGTTGVSGTPVVGGTPAPGGTTAAGGRSASSGTGGVTASAGTVGTGGSLVATGGNVASGGAIETGGFSASGGAASTSPVSSGGSPTAGGSPGTGELGGTTSEMGPAQANASGCSCRVAGAQSSCPGVAALAFLMLAFCLRRKR
jgi:Right handed beta helix region/Protein of unknown function (DUF1565)